MPRLRLLKKYPFDEVIDKKITHNGRQINVFQNETSLLQNLDLSSTDSTLRDCVERAFAPQSVDYLSSEETKTDNIFECLNPITSRFATDRCLRQQILDALSDELNNRLKSEEETKKKEELKKKYDDFIAQLG